ncbi:MAG: AAA family ATPase, partial [Planctomycetes bacterium]|nr:AAA family ATPase [Planctomycetota bacterium]
MKLKSLTLTGFKSFPNKTTFEFHDGITCIVGPNGAGKSNIVDAFKWVLGEQSAKSLRGNEMMDVIFSGSVQKRQSNYAEVILTFTTNCTNEGPSKEGTYIPADEQETNNQDEATITVARRLYRNGQSEYFLNGKIVRLKDIREMFLDTGANSKGYSIIEQGKVEVFLQASPTDRRAAFDEAAGIAKYKMRKIEAIRRLERVEQNLLRLNDILTEVRKRLRSIKYQASKARNYQTYSTRLAELQSLFSLAQYHQIITHRKDVQQQADRLTDALSNVKTKISQLETSQISTETEISEIQQKNHDIETQLAQLSSQISTTQQQIDMLNNKEEELTSTINAKLSAREQLEAKIASNQQEMSQRQQYLAEVSKKVEQLTIQLQHLSKDLDAARSRTQSLRAQLEEQKSGSVELLRQSANLHNKITAAKLLCENLINRKSQLKNRIDEINQTISQMHSQKSADEAKLAELNALTEELSSKLQQISYEANLTNNQEKRLQEELSALREEQSALLSRKALLEQLEQNREGIGQATKAVLQAAAKGELPFVIGLLGDFIETDTNHANIIESALAGAEQWIIVSSLEQLTQFAPKIRQITSQSDKVNFICLDSTNDDLTPLDETILQSDDIVARANQWVRCNDQRVSSLINNLLAKTLVVKSLQSAIELSRQLGDGWQFIALSGELVKGPGLVQLPAGQDKQPFHK